MSDNLSPASADNTALKTLLGKIPPSLQSKFAVADNTAPRQTASHAPHGPYPQKLYLAILATAIITGLAFNVLLGGAPGIGLNLVLAMAVFFAGWLYISNQRPVPLWRKLCAGAAIVYAGALAFRASEILFVVNLMLMVGFTALSCTPAYTRIMKNAFVSIIDLMHVIFNAGLGSVLLAIEAPWRRFKLRNRSTRIITGILGGMAIAVPFLLVFGLLFSRAEVRFGELFDAFFTTLAETIFSNFWITFFTTIISLGLLRSAFLRAPVSDDNVGSQPGDRIGIGFVESATVLSLLNAMFALFVITQVPYLFGGQNQVSSTPDLAWSEYARRGFFELAWVATLLIPTLMLFMGCTRTTNPRQVRTVQGFCGGLSLLTGIIIISALQRMLLYTHNFGLTELRIYVSTFIVMLALVIVMLNYLAFTGRSRLFLPAALATGFIVSVGMQVPNIQGLIAADIIERRESGGQGDMQYLSELSPDAIPAIMKSKLDTPIKNEVSRQIFKHVFNDETQSGWLYQPLSVRTALHWVRPAGPTPKKYR